MNFWKIAENTMEGKCKEDIMEIARKMAFE